MRSFYSIIFITVIISCNLNNQQEKNSFRNTVIVIDEGATIPNPIAKSLYEEGIQYTRKHDYQHDIQLLMKANSICPNQLCIITNIGTDYAIINKIDSALFYYDKALRLNPNYSKTYVNYSKLLIRLKRHTEAVKMARLGLFIDSLPVLNKEMLNFNLAIAYYNLNLYDSALNALDAAKSCNIDHDRQKIMELESLTRSMLKN